MREIVSPNQKRVSIRLLYHQTLLTKFRSIFLSSLGFT